MLKGPAVGFVWPKQWRKKMQLNPRKVGRKGSVKVCEGHSAFWLLRNQFPFAAKMSLVFYWPISFKLPTPFAGHPKCLGSKKWEQQWGGAVCSLCIHICSGITFFIHQCPLTRFACAHLLYELDASVFSMWFFTLLPVMLVCLYVCACDIEHVYVKVLNLCSAMKDRKGWFESQSVPLQINSLVPDPSFLQNTHYLQRLPFFFSPPPSLLSPLLLPCTLCLLCQSCYLPGLLCICVGERWIL